MPRLSALIQTAHTAHTAHAAAVDCAAPPSITARLSEAADAALAAVTAAHPAGITQVSVEVTDAIHDGMGWSANGCWVNRHTLWVPAGCSPSYLSRRIKAAAGYSAVRGETWDSGDLWRFRPYGCAVLVFASFD